METTPPTPDPTDHQGPSEYEGWDPSPDPAGEVDIPASAGSGLETADAPGIAFVPDATPDRTADRIGERGGERDERDDEILALRERLAYYESFDRLIRDSVDRAGALMREAATKQGDAEVKLRSTRRDFERRQIEERSGYRSVFATLLDDVSTLQQQVERMARQVSDALDDLEMQLPAAGELAAIERGGVLGMTGYQPSTPEPAELPSGASSAAWVTHDGDLQGAGAGRATQPPPVSPVDDSDDPDAVDPQIVQDVLTEYTDVDPAVAGAESDPESAALADAADLPEEFGLADPVSGAGAGTVGEPYVERSVAEGSEGAADLGPADDLDPLDEHLGVTARSEGFYVEHTVDADDLALVETPLRQAAPAEIGEVDQGLEEPPADEPTEVSGDNRSVADAPAGIAYGHDLPRATTGGPELGAVAANDQPAEQDTVVLVHGVPRATTALSLKRYLEGLAAVSAVEPREYAEGVLRLQVTGERPIRMDDLSAWPDGSGLQEILIRDDLVEIRLPG